MESGTKIGLIIPHFPSAHWQCKSAQKTLLPISSPHSIGDPLLKFEVKMCITFSLSWEIPSSESCGKM